MKWFGFAIVGDPADVPFTNLYVGADLDYITKANEMGMKVLFPIGSLFWIEDPQSGILQFDPNWRTNWDTYKPTVHHPTKNLSTLRSSLNFSARIN